MNIELNTDLLLVKHFHSVMHTYELWMVPKDNPANKQCIHSEVGENGGDIHDRINLVIRQTMDNLKEEGISLPVLWVNGADEIFIVRET